MSETTNFDIGYLITHKEVFNDFVYTPLNKVIDCIKDRENDSVLDEYIKNTLPVGMPKIIDGKKTALLSRSIVAPNFETRRFISLINTLEDFHPLFWEYSQDRFTPNVNSTKYNLGKLTFYQGIDRKGLEKLRKFNILDFNLYNGKRMSEIKTIWGQPLIDFHHEFLENTLSNQIKSPIEYFDASDWYVKSGVSVEVYYKYMMILLLKRCFMFENFILSDDNEISFIKNIFLPAFIEVYQLTGFKPLIVALAPSDIESSNFWMYYPHESLAFVKNKVNLI